MPEVKIYNLKGAEVGAMELNETVFGVPYNEALIHQVVVAQAANKRQGTHSNLTRSEVRGGGIKPWRQKGTGRARQGSIRSPQWTGGGVVFAKKPRDFSKKINIKQRRHALKSALSYKLTNGEIKVLENFAVESGKTKDFVNILGALNFKGSILVVLPEMDQMTLRAGSNIQKLNITYANLLNVYDVVKHVNILTTKAGVEKIQEVCSL